MIGGVDVRIPSRAADSSIEVATRAIRQRWGRAVFENALSGGDYRRFAEIPFGEIEELFIYRDAAAATLWDDEGAVPDARNSMIHLIADEGMITVVVDSRDAEMEAILSAIRSGLEDEILKGAAMREAA